MHLEPEGHKLTATARRPLSFARGAEGSTDRTDSERAAGLPLALNLWKSAKSVDPNGRVPCGWFEGEAACVEVFGVPVGFGAECLYCHPIVRKKNQLEH